jgi:hypothetical protein
MNMAASPPNKRNVIKIIESEKFKIYFDLGRVILIRGAIKIVEANKRANVHEIVPSFKRKKARTKQKIPKTAIRILNKFEIESRFIQLKAALN